MSEQKTVLTADDDSAVRLAVRTRLAALGYNVVEAADGLGVIAKCRSTKIDLLVLDHRMPLGDGRDVATLIRTHTDAPIIFLSGEDKETFRAAVLKIPDCYFLPKPFDGARLTALLESLLGPHPNKRQASRAPATADSAAT